MSTKALGILTLLMIAIVAIAVFIYRGRTPGDVPVDDTLLLPELRTIVNDITTIDVAGGATDFTVVREGETWRVKTRAGYPAKIEKVKEVLVGLAELEVVEAKTSNPELYDRIGVGDPTADDNDSTTLVTLSRDDATAASVIIGNRGSGGTKTRWYVRLADAPQSQLVEGSLQTIGDDLQWIDREVLAWRDRVRDVTIEHADGEMVRVARENAATRTFNVLDIPQGFEEQRAGVANTIGTVLNTLRLDDVASAPTLELGEPEVFVNASTFDGLSATILVYDVEGVKWLTLQADAAATEAAPAEDTANPGEEAAELNDRLNGWAFQVSDYIYTNLAKRQSELIKATESADAEGETEGPPIP